MKYQAYVSVDVLEGTMGGKRRKTTLPVAKFYKTREKEESSRGQKVDTPSGGTPGSWNICININGETINHIIFGGNR